MGDQSRNQSRQLMCTSSVLIREQKKTPPSVQFCTRGRSRSRSGNRPEPLCACRLFQRGPKAHLVRQQPGMRDHDTIVDAEALVGGVDAPAAIPRHEAHHLLQTLVAADAADDQHLSGADVGHGALGDLDEHGEDGFLQGEAEVLTGGLLGALDVHQRLRLARQQLAGELVDHGQDPREGAVHALDRVRQVQQVPAALRQLLDVVPRSGIVADLQRAREPVETVADGDVERFAEDPVPSRLCCQPALLLLLLLFFFFLYTHILGGGGSATSARHTR